MSHKKDKRRTDELESSKTESSVRDDVHTFSYKAKHQVDDTILFDRRTQFGEKDEAVFEMYKAMFPLIVQSMNRKNVMRTVYKQELTIHNEMSHENSTIFDSDQYDETSDLEEEQMTRDVPPTQEQPLPFRERLEMIKQMINKNTHVSNRKLRQILGSKYSGPNFEDRTNSVKCVEKDRQVRITFLNGNIYTGRMSRYCFEGDGHLQCPDGSSYRGTFEKNKMHGRGRLEWANQSWYEGEMWNNTRHGYGMYKNTQSRSEFVYIGHWNQGRRHGCGRQYYDFHKDDYYDGEFEMDKRHGQGRRQWRNKQMYKGSWINDTMEGFGIMRFPNNDSYRGMWHQGLMHGYGEYVWRNPLTDQFVLPQVNIYRGLWRCGQRHGGGIFQTSTNVLYEGTWLNGEKHGLANVMLSNGTVLLNVVCHGDTLYERQPEAYDTTKGTGDVSTVETQSNENTTIDLTLSRNKSNALEHSLYTEVSTKYKRTTWNDVGTPVGCTKNLISQHLRTSSNDSTCNIPSYQSQSTISDSQKRSARSSGTKLKEKLSNNSKLKPTVEKKKKSNLPMSEMKYSPLPKSNQCTTICQKVPSDVTQGDPTNICKDIQEEEDLEEAEVSQCVSTFSMQSTLTDLPLSSDKTFVESCRDTKSNLYYRNVYEALEPIVDIEEIKSTEQVNVNHLNKLSNIRINVPDHLVELDFYIIRYLKLKNDYRDLYYKHYPLRRNQKNKTHKKTISKFTQEYTIELIWLRNCIETYLPNMRKLYDHYSKIMCDGHEPTFDCCLTKLMFWQMVRDYGLHKCMASLVVLDKILLTNPYIKMKNVFNPFEMISFWMFVHCCIELAWLLFNGEKKSQQTIWPTHLAGCLYRLMVDKFKKQNEEGDALRTKLHSLPLNVAYKQFQQMGNPLTMRRLLHLMTTQKEDKHSNVNICEILGHAQEPIGRNMIDLGVNFKYTTDKQQINMSDVKEQASTTDSKKKPDNTFSNTFLNIQPIPNASVKNLTNLRTKQTTAQEANTNEVNLISSMRFFKLEATEIVRIFYIVCPHSSNFNRLDVEINFLEYLEILILLCELNAEKMRRLMKLEMIQNFLTQYIIPLRPNKPKMWSDKEKIDGKKTAKKK